MKNSVIFFSVLVLLSCSITANASHSRRHHTKHHQSGNAVYSWEQAGFDLSPVNVQPYIVPTTLTPKQTAFYKKMHLENGMYTKATRYISRRDIRSRDLFILHVTQSLEGGFDSVNMYDRGILSWGIMQWTVWTGSLPRTLQYMKRRLIAAKNGRIWEKVFVANGIDVDRGGLIVYGKRMNNEQDMRLAFRGTMKPGEYDPKLAAHWATTFARAGRHPIIAQLQIDYASHIVSSMMQTRMGGLHYHAPGRSGLTPADLAANDPYTEALIFVLWTNNPRNAWAYIGEAARTARSVSTTDDPSLWKPGAFSAALVNRCRISRFGNWQRRAQMVQARADFVRSAPASQLSPFEQQYQTVLALRKAKRQQELSEKMAAIERARQEKLVRMAKKLPSPLTSRHMDVRPVLIPKTDSNNKIQINGSRSITANTN